MRAEADAAASVRLPIEADKTASFPRCVRRAGQADYRDGGELDDNPAGEKARHLGTR